MNRHPIDYEIDETCPPERRPVEGGGLVLILALSIAAVIGFAAGYAMGDIPHHTPPPGFDICTTRGC